LNGQVLNLRVFVRDGLMSIKPALGALRQAVLPDNP
jgi:hypothetical protein